MQGQLDEKRSCESKKNGQGGKGQGKGRKVNRWEGRSPIGAGRS